MSRGYSCLLLAALVAVPVASCRGEATATQDTLQTATPSAADQAAPMTGSPPSGNIMEDCDSLPIADKEACYARQDPALVLECERMRMHHCAPYAKLHGLEKRLDQLTADLLQATRKRYASYEDDQPGYVNDLERLLVDTDRAWRAYRDANCNLLPFIQGMSRKEVADLAEACRSDMTTERVNEIEQMLSIFMEETSNEQRKQ